VVFHPWGSISGHFEILTDKFGTDRIHSFQGAHQVYAGSVRVDHVDIATPELTPDYLFSNWMPSTIFHWISKLGRKRGQRQQFSVTFDGGGINLTGPNATTVLPPNVLGILCRLWACMIRLADNLLHLIRRGGLHLLVDCRQRMVRRDKLERV
jgi:hypothetical protein